MIGELKSIVYKPQNMAAAGEGYVRVPLQAVMLLAEHGIEGDAKGGSSSRQLNIMAAETVQQLGAEGFHAAAGELGEQLILAQIPIDSLPVGTCLQIGTTARVEITEPRTGCAKFERYQGRQRSEASGRLGMMARVIMEGPIHVGDVITIVERKSITSI